MAEERPPVLLGYDAAQINEAVGDRHSHANMEILNAITRPPEDGPPGPQGPPGADGRLTLAFRVDERGHLLLSSEEAVGERFRINRETGHLEYITDWG